MDSGSRPDGLIAVEQALNGDRRGHAGSDDDTGHDEHGQAADREILVGEAQVSVGRSRAAVELTYVRAAGSQEAVAELLDLPFSTYRRALAAGVDRLVATLWEREVHGASRTSDRAAIEHEVGRPRTGTRDPGA